jgi:glycosyltransferase involved in cell wall biosynthesis
MKKSRNIPEFSVCIPTYNNISAFSRCLYSVLYQQDITLECIVSDDSTTSEIANYITCQSDTRIIYSRNIPTLGVPENWNRAIEIACGQYITLLHHDDFYISKNTLKKIYITIQTEKADVLFCGHALYKYEKCLGEYPLSMKKIKNFYQKFPGRTLVVNTLGHPSIGFFHQRHKNILYDTTMLYFSDTEYFARLISEAKIIAVCKEPLVAINRSDSQLSANCLARLDALVKQLACGLRKHDATNLQSGLSLARFFASNMRHLRKCDVTKVIHSAGNEFSTRMLAIAALSFPVFFLHMLYRAAYRHITGKRWG